MTEIKMKMVACFVVSLLVAEVSASHLFRQNKVRSKRGLFEMLFAETNTLRSTYTFNLASHVACYQNISSWDSVNAVKLVATKYLNYGCYCGHGGDGEPLDGIDRCCQAHDACCIKADKHQYGIFAIKIAHYFGTYTFSCNTRDGARESQCESSNNYERALCKCDQVFAECIRSADPDFSNWNRKFVCVRGNTPKENARCSPDVVERSKQERCAVPDILGHLRQMNIID